MSSAAIILLLMALLAIGGWVVSDIPLSAGTVIDIALGILLLKRHHSWRIWVLVRAGLGLVIGAVILLASAMADPVSPKAVMIGLGQCAYCGALFLLLYGTPVAWRVLAGRCLSALAFALLAVVFFTGPVAAR